MGPGALLPEEETSQSENNDNSSSATQSPSKDQGFEAEVTEGKYSS